MLNDVQAKRCILFDGLRMVKEWRVITMYKLRIYKTYGQDKGKLDHEEYFDTKELLDKRYKDLFKRELYALNPTAWEKIGEEWKRLEGY